MDKRTKEQMEELRAWSLLIPRIEEVLDTKLRPEYKCIVIKKIIEQERNRDDDALEVNDDGD